LSGGTTLEKKTTIADLDVSLKFFLVVLTTVSKPVERKKNCNPRRLGGMRRLSNKYVIFPVDSGIRGMEITPNFSEVICP